MSRLAAFFRFRFSLIFPACVLSALLPSLSRAVTATSLASFEGIEEPLVRFYPAPGTFQPDNFINITDVGGGTFRMFLRYEPEWWDGDRDTPNKDRQRAEVKGLGPHQHYGDTFEYATTWRTSPGFRGTSRFCHVFQLKATNGDSGAPLVTLSVETGADEVAVKYWPGHEKNSLTVRQFHWKPGTWQTVRIRIKTSLHADGAVLVSVDGDNFQGVTGVAVFRPDADDYRPKWGLYRGAKTGMAMGDDYVEHRNVSAEKLAASETMSQNASPSVSVERDLADATLLARSAENNPAAAMQAVEALPAGPLRQDALRRVYNRWADRDLPAANAWLAAHAPSPELDDLLWYQATDTTYRYVNRPVALNAASLITDPTRRALAFEHVTLIWNRANPTEADAYVAASTALSPAQKEALLKKLRAGKGGAGD
jgi:hypothetical protein